MIEHLSTLVENFPGTANQTRCFTHVLNLAAKSILCQFDVPKKTADGDAGDLDDATDTLAALAQELEEAVGQIDDEADADDDNEKGDGGDEDGDDGDNDEDGLDDERDSMSEEELAELEESLVPIRLMLTKVSQNYLIRNYLIILSHTASSSRKRYEEFVHHHPPSMARKA
jgi:nucleoside-diphosphate-sugar epimerase